MGLTFFTSFHRSAVTDEMPPCWSACPLMYFRYTQVSARRPDHDDRIPGVRFRRKLKVKGIVLLEIAIASSTAPSTRRMRWGM